MEKPRSSKRKMTYRKKYMTKLKMILIQKDLNYMDLRDILWDKFNVLYGADRIANIANGITVNLTIKTYVMLAKALEVPLGDIVNEDMVMGNFPPHIPDSDKPKPKNIDQKRINKNTQKNKVVLK
jgi:hypothetical protein